MTLPRGATVESPEVQAQLRAALHRIAKAVPGSRIASFASTGDRTFVSRDGRTTFALVFIPGKGGIDPGQHEARAAQDAVARVTVGGAPVRVTGLDALRAGAADGGQGGGAGLAAEAAIAGGGALLVLAFVFASWMAVVPLLMAAAAIPTTFLAVWPLASATDVSVIVKVLIALVGLAIAIDYALLVVVRWREERQRGATPEGAVVAAMEHAGRAVVFSGTTVAISLLALVVLPVPFLRSIGIAGMLIPLVSVAVALSLLPVVLSTLGPRLDRRHAARQDRPGRGWSAWAGFVVRHRASAAVLSGAVLVGLVVAASTIQLGNPRAESLAGAGPARAGLDQLERSGIGTGPLSPFDTLVAGGDPQRVVATLERLEGVRGVIAPRDWRQEGTSLVSVVPTADGNSPAGRATLDRIRAATGQDALTGGEAAQSADFLDAVYGDVVLVIGLIAGLTFLLLARAFRSIVIPLKAVLLNLLSVGAAWGLMVLVWQHGLGSEAVWGIEATDAINVEMPIVVFAFLFGISMDYHVFILSRMREAYDRTGSTEAAVVEGIGRTGRLVTSAALILGLAFVAMSTAPGTEAKMFATALGGGILLDATLIRGVLVPATVALLGRWNWWLPRRAARALRVVPAPSPASR
ncbi:MMPL family transporter [Conexibacter sp. SYSU D00693]|uniref:MMPL family transporter n=1 Tax=Conexibacter sp. SYSU D00693 TaxID=2812560 RepID=UPI00196AEEE5|nr:MMPL family transporter [Conexibacter sp. SYSU D00693]